MTITEKKPLFIQIPGEITPNELPVSASAVGYDFIQGNYLIYATGSDSWVTAPPNTAGIKEYWQSDINNEIFTTGSVTISGNVNHSQYGLIENAIYAHVGGYNTTASANFAHAEGYATVASGTNSHAEGIYTLALGVSSHTEGYFTTASNNAHAEGAYTLAAGDGSHSEGYRTFASGSNSHAEGNETSAIGNASHSEGSYTIATGYAAHAEGWLTTGSGDYSHSEGYLAIASGTHAHAEGSDTQAIGEGSHAEGGATIANALASHAEGILTFADGYAAHAEGIFTIASGVLSHAEGGYTLALGNGSHTEGYLTTGSGLASHAQGYLTDASGSYSFAGGVGTIASGSGQSVLGQYNKRNNDFSLFVIGDGSSDADVDRHDVLRVDTGRVEVSGTLASTAGFSGSLTTLTDGSPYLIAGTNIELSTGSNGSITINTSGSINNVFWQSDSAGHIYTTGSIKVSGNVILGDASSDVVYISGSVTASNGLLVNGNLNVSGGIVTYGGTTVDGGTIVGQQFEDTDTSGNSYGLVIKNSGTGNGVPFLSFVQGATLASGFAGGIGGWTKAPSSGYIPGLNLSFYSSYPRIGIRNAAASTNIATFDANGLQVTGSVNVSNGVKVAAGGLQVAGIVPGISAPYNQTPVIIDLATGQTYGPVIRSVAGQYNFAALSLDQNGTYLGGIYGLENDPGGFGYVDGVNLYVNGASRKINFNVNQTSVGRFTSNGLQVTGSINGSSTITAATGFSGSLTKLTDGTSYIIAGNGISVSSASNGAITISSSVSSVTPGGSDTYVQFNDAGIFGGVSTLTFNKTSNTLSTTNLAVSNIATVSGSVILGDAASDVVYISGSVTASNGLTVTGASNFFGVKEKFNTKSGATGTVVHDCSTGHIFYHSGSTANWTSNFTNLSMSNGYATTITLVVTQSSNAYIPSAIQLDGVGQTLNWQGNVTPTGTASRRDVISFSILNVSSSYIVLGQFVSF